jgi:hypothetical protein
MSRLYGISERSFEPDCRSALACDRAQCLFPFAGKATWMVVPRRPLLACNPGRLQESAEKHPLCCDLRCAPRRSGRASRRHNSTSHACHVFESTLLLLSSCCSCTHLAHDHIDHDLSYDYDVRSIDLPKHALSVTTPLYDDDPVGPPAIETPGSWTWIVDDQRVFQKEQQQKITSRIVQHRW